MNAMTIDPAVPADKLEVTLTRIYDVPPSLVWQAWTEPEHIMQWWGPHGFDAPRAEVDLRKGGKMEIDMRGPDGGIMTATCVISEIDVGRKLVLDTSGFTGPDGKPQLRVIQTITFEDAGTGKTRLTVHAKVVQATAALAPAVQGQKEGWSQTLDKLGTYVEGLGGA